MPVQRKLAVNEDHFHHGGTGFAAERGCWNDMTELSEVRVPTPCAFTLLKKDDHDPNEKTVTRHWKSQAQEMSLFTTGGRREYQRCGNRQVV